MPGPDTAAPVALFCRRHLVRHPLLSVAKSTRTVALGCDGHCRRRRLSPAPVDSETVQWFHPTAMVSRLDLLPFSTLDSQEAGKGAMWGTAGGGASSTRAIDQLLSESSGRVMWLGKSNMLRARRAPTSAQWQEREGWIQPESRRPARGTTWFLDSGLSKRSQISVP